MIIARSPLRISLGGGGTDLPSYYRKHGGFVISAAIDRYVYIALHRRFVPEILLKYSKFEQIERVEEIQHPIFREALRLTGVASHVEIVSMADIPSGTGLGSSGSFTTALLTVLNSYKGHPVLPPDLAEQACDIEINRLGEPIGKQDQYISALGGVMSFNFNSDETVSFTPMNLKPETLNNLEDNLLLFFTGYSRSARAILKEQDDRSRGDDESMIDNLHYVKDMGHRSEAFLAKNDLVGFGELMNEHWEYKKKRSGMMTNPDIERWYKLALQNGAVGGKLVGAGGGGFLMFYVMDKTRVCRALSNAGLEEVRFSFEFEGAKVIAS